MRLRFEVTGFSARGERADFGALRLLLSLLCISLPACPSFPLLSLSLSIVPSLASYLVWSDTALGATARCPQASSHSDVRPWQRCPPPPRVLPFVGLPCRSSAALRAQAAGVLPASSPVPQCGRARARTDRTPSPPQRIRPAAERTTLSSVALSAATPPSRRTAGRLPEAASISPDAGSWQGPRSFSPVRRRVNGSSVVSNFPRQGAFRCPSKRNGRPRPVVSIFATSVHCTAHGAVRHPPLILPATQAGITCARGCRHPSVVVHAAPCLISGSQPAL